MTRLLLVVGEATGGMGSHVDALSTGLPAPDWSVTVFTSPRTRERFSLGGSVITAWRGGPGGRFRAVRDLRRLMLSQDVVHAHGHQAGLATILAARTLPRRRRPRVVISWHNAVLVGGLKGRLLALAEAVQARGADLLTGASADLVERAESLGAAQPELAEVASRPVPEIPTPAAGRSSGHAVLTVSRIAPQKRIDVLVEAAALVSRRLPGLTWLVAGDGDPELLAGLRRRVAATRAPVTFLGARRDVADLMAAADVFALPSAWEARALVVQEAMAGGLAVVASDVGGLPDLIADTGLLVPPGDPVALANAVELLLTDRELAAELSRKARERFAGLPTEADVIAAWSARYRALVRRGSADPRGG